jgi:hypothetical protein
MTTKSVEFILRVDADEEGVSVKLFTEEDEFENMPDYDPEITELTYSGTIRYYHTLDINSDFRYVFKE